LIDSSGKTFCPVKDGFNGIVGNQFSRRLSPFEVEVDVDDGIIKGKADQIMGIPERFADGNVSVVSKQK